MITNENIDYTKVWKVNDRLVIADNAHEAINVYSEWWRSLNDYSFDPEIESVIAVSNDVFHDPIYDAIIRVNKKENGEK